MLEGFLAALAFGFVSVLAWLAFKFPKSYAKLTTPMSIIAAVIVVALLAYNTGHQHGLRAAREALNEIGASTIGIPYFSEPFSYLGIMISVIAFSIYTSVLQHIHEILAALAGEREGSSEPTEKTPRRTQEKSRTDRRP